VIVTNPTGIIEPAWLGALWLDSANNIFYQARGRTAADWHFVPPADFLGSFVKIYNQFYGIPDNDPKDAEAAMRYADAKVIRDTMALCGVEMLGLGGLRWQTADGVDVLQVRLRFSRFADLSIFVGFAPEARAWAMPEGVGFRIEDGVLSFGGKTAPLHLRQPYTLRIEIGGVADAFLGDQHVGTAYGVVVPTRPVVALFDRGPGPRPVAPGYERALKRNVDA
jgi:hypothetical protein